jgi:hypothetical protein
MYDTALTDGNGRETPDAPKTAKESMKIMTWAPPSSAPPKM